MKNLLRFVAVIMVTLLPFVLSAQTIHPVAAGTDGLNTALAGAASGDIIELTTSGGEYFENDSLIIDFGITFRAAAGLAEQPIMRCKSGNMFRLTQNLGTADDWWLNLEGIHIDAMKITGGDTTYITGKLIDVDESTTYYSLKIEGCTLSNLQNKIMWPTETSYCDSALYINNIFQYGLVKKCDGLFFRNSGTVGYVLMENSTFWNSGGMFADVRGGENVTTGLNVIPRIIFQNLTISGNDQPWPVGIIYGKATVKNIIISNRANGYSAGGWFKLKGIDAASGALASHILQDSTNQGKDAFALGDDFATLDSTTWQWNVDPMFDDPLNGSFNLVEGSPAIGAADDGGNLGDPRWTVVPATSVDNNMSTTPVAFSLEQNYPNPFNPITTIRYTIQKSSHVSLNVYNSLGQQVATLINQQMETGSHHAVWNASSSPSGIYFYKLLVDGKTSIGKMILMK